MLMWNWEDTSWGIKYSRGRENDWDTVFTVFGSATAKEKMDDSMMFVLDHSNDKETVAD